MEVEDSPVKEPNPTQISYKSKLIGIIPMAFEKAFYFEQILVEFMEDEVDEFPELKCIKNLSSREENMVMRQKHALDIIIKMCGKYIDYPFLCKR